MISIVDPVYGAVMNDPNVDNWPALMAAWEVANDTGLECIGIPSGTLYLTIPADVTGAQVAAGARILVKGESRETTRIVAQSDASGDTFLFTVAAGGALILQDFTAIGPSNPNGYQTRLASHSGTDGALTVYRVATENYLTPLYMYSGATCDLTVRECDFDSQANGPTSLQVGAADIRRARIERCQFSGFGLANSAQAHGVYIHQGVDVEVIDCFFERQYGSGYAIQLYGGAGVSPHARIAGCHFASDVYQSVLSNATVVTMISGCRFLDMASSVVAQFDTEIHGCVFSAPTLQASPIAQAGSQPALIRVMNSRFDIPANGVYAVNVGVIGSRAELHNCRMSCNAAYAATAVNGATWQLYNCAFLDEVGHLTLKSKGVTPAISAPATGIANASAAGNDMRGYVQFDVTAVIPAGTALFTFAPNKQYSAAPYMQVTNMTSDKQAVAFGVSAVGYAGFVVRNLTPLAPATGLKCSYLVVC